MDTLETFLKTGNLNQVQVGASMTEIRQLLGDPKDVSVARKPTIWKFGPLQISFWKDAPDAEATVCFLGLYGAPDREQMPARLSWTGVTPRQFAAKSDFTAYLARSGLDPQVETTTNEEERWRLPSGVCVLFVDDQLQSIQYLQRGESKKKQLAISLSQPLWNRVRDEAERRQISPAQFCAELIQKELV